MKSVSREQASLHAQEARRLWSERKLYESRNEVQRAIELDPTNPAHYHGLGVVALEIGDIHEAREALDRAELLLPNHPHLRPVLFGPIRYNQAQVLYRSGKLDEALASWAEAYAEFERERLTDFQRMCAQNASWGAAEAGRSEEAQSWLDLAEAHIKTTEDRYRQNLAAAYIYLTAGQLTNCLRMVEYLHAQPDTPDDVRSFAASLAAMASARAGEEGPARAMTTYAIEVAYRAGVDNRCWLFAAKADREVKKQFYREGA